MAMLPHGEFFGSNTALFENQSLADTHFSDYFQPAVISLQGYKDGGLIHVRLNATVFDQGETHFFLESSTDGPANVDAVWTIPPGWVQNYFMAIDDYGNPLQANQPLLPNIQATPVGNGQTADDGTPLSAFRVMVDLIAYGGYKFVGIIFTLTAGFLGLKCLLWTLVFLYAFAANAFFLFRSLRASWSKVEGTFKFIPSRLYTAVKHFRKAIDSWSKFACLVAGAGRKAFIMHHPSAWDDGSPSLIIILMGLTRREASSTE
ncbi:hypothetical protein BDN70DRAFT_998066 [Pholiota conissans]|uniref:Protein YIF1 n=1 Tax=Pholiota conissans TaxID=109636 RepID=A0A9P5YPF3_9AGAR|nr:hypothetical protein BDN70DRAFT_998066 [Pholiota conissans]